MSIDYVNLDNRLAMLRAIRQAGKITRRDLAGKVAISVSMATKITAGLIEQGLVCEKGKLEASNAGRPMEWLALVPEAAYAVGLHMNHTRYIAVVADLNGDIVAHLVDPILVTDDRAAILQGIKDLIARVIKLSGVPKTAVAGAGVGLSDIVDPVTKTSYGWPDLPGWSAAWVNFPVGDALASVLPYDHLFVDDIVRAQGLAEARYGAGTPDSDFVYVLVDEGVGMAIMLNGTPYIGYSHIAGEIAHIPVTDSTEPCSCGNSGCLQIVSGARAVLRQLKARLAESSTRSSLRYLEHEPELADVFSEAENGDKLAVQVLSESGEALGKALAVVVNLLGPRAIVLGGAFSRSNVFVEAAQRSMKLHALVMAARDVAITRSRLDELGGARGAACQVLDALFEPGPNNILERSVKSPVSSRRAKR